MLTQGTDGTENRVALEIRSLWKSFPGTVALSDFNIVVRAGEVHSLIGGNGSGKSTFVKVLTGVIPASSGTLCLGQDTYDLRHFKPTDARRSGVQAVHQHRTTFPSLTVAENLTIGRGFEKQYWGSIRWKEVRDRTHKLLSEYGISADPDSRVDTLSSRSQTMIEIARVLQSQEGEKGKVLALDEPTAALPPEEASLLLASLRDCAVNGQAVLFISHRLDEVLEVSDRITVLRDGHCVATLERATATRDRLIELMVGHTINFPSGPKEPRKSDIAALAVQQLSGGAVKDVTFDVDAGEVLGIAGLAGSGRSTLLRLLFGAQTADGGVMLLDNTPYSPRDPADAIRRGVAYVPEDRARDAMFPHMTMMENYSVAWLRSFATGLRLRSTREYAATAQAADQFRIKTPGPEAPISSLSGGNQQKVSVARWMIQQPRLLLLDEPSQGVDVEARGHLWQIVRTAAEMGTAILLVSSDLEELTGLSDRLLVLNQGRVVSELTGPHLAPSHVDRSLHTAGVSV